jgi:hypothetical protein
VDEIQKLADFLEERYLRRWGTVSECLYIYVLRTWKSFNF